MSLKWKIDSKETNNYRWKDKYNKKENSNKELNSNKENRE